MTFKKNQEETAALLTDLKHMYARLFPEAKIVPLGRGVAYTPGQ